MEVLEQLHLAPSMYLATVLEVVRRRSFSEHYLGRLLSIDSSSIVPVLRSRAVFLSVGAVLKKTAPTLILFERKAVVCRFDNNNTAKRTLATVAYILPIPKVNENLFLEPEPFIAGILCLEPEPTYLPYDGVDFGLPKLEQPKSGCSTK